MNSDFVERMVRLGAMGLLWFDRGPAGIQFYDNQELKAPLNGPLDLEGALNWLDGYDAGRAANG